MQNKRRGKCHHCKEFYRKEARNFWHQRYCEKSECRKASKAQSQRRWFQKSENQNYFRGNENVERVRAWRKNNPRYWRRGSNKISSALQEVITAQPIDIQDVKRSSNPGALQDLLSMQHPLVLGLISMMTGDALQENIEQTTRSLLSRGYQILGIRPQVQPGDVLYENQKSGLSSTTASDSSAVQLGGSAIDSG